MILQVLMRMLHVDEAKMVVSSRVKGKIGADYYKVYYGDSNLIGKYKRKTFCSVI